MKRPTFWLIAAGVFALSTAACNRDNMTGIATISPRVEGSTKKLTDAIAFFTRQFRSPVVSLGSSRRSRRMVAASRSRETRTLASHPCT